jgi:bifunctional non-homologous end joining protein LigD
VKCLKQQELVIGGYTKPEGSRVGFGALLMGYYDNGDLIYAGRVGTGFTTESLRQLTADLKKRAVDSPPFENPPTGYRRRGVTWVRPELVAEIEFSEWTSDGHLRHPSFQGLREDKPAKEVVREKPKSLAAVEDASKRDAPKKRQAADRKSSKSSAPSKRSATRTSNEAEVAGVRITNPDRVLYPQQGLTKLDLAEYYEQVADWILPYVADRPLTLVRCPEGHTGECFYQKHLTGSMPDAVQGVMVKEKGKQKEYARCSGSCPPSSTSCRRRRPSRCRPSCPSLPSRSRPSCPSPPSRSRCRPSCRSPRPGQDRPPSSSCRRSRSS